MLIFAESKNTAMEELFKKLDAYFEETPIEKIREAWDEASEEGVGGITVKELLNRYRNVTVGIPYKLDPKFTSGFFFNIKNENNATNRARRFFTE